MSQPLKGGPNIIRLPIADPKGNITPIWQQCFSDMLQRIQKGLNIIGQFTGEIANTATVQGKAGTLSGAIANLTPTGQLNAVHLTGIVPAAQLPAAIPAAQGAVQLPAGAPSNILGSAALQNSTAFDPAGAAATAQAAAEAASDPVGSAATALTNAKAYANNLFAAGLSVTITTAQLTTLGTQGSMTFTNGLLTAQTPAT